MVVLVFASAAAPAPADRFSVVPDNASPTAGDTINITVTAQDPSLVTDTGYPGTVTFTSSDGQAVLPRDYTFTAGSGGDNGVHVFAVTLKTAGSQTVTVTDTSTPSITGVSSSISVAPAAASQFTLNPSDSSPTAGLAFDVGLTALDTYGNTDTNYDGAKTIVYTGPGNSPGPVTTSPDYPASATAVTFTDGAGTATGIRLFDANSTETLTATEQSTTVSGSAALAVGPAAASQFTLNPSDSSPTAGLAFDVGLTALDPYGNTDTNYDGAKTIVYTGPGNSPGPVTTSPDYPASATAVTFTDGAGTATGIRLFDANSTETLTATEQSTTVSGSAARAVGPAAASQFALTTTATTVTAGQARNLTITAMDPYGNTDGGYTGDKGLTFSGANSSPNGTQPTVTNKTGTAVVFGTAEIITFSSGVATVTSTNNGVMKLYKAESPNITVSAGLIHTTTALAMTVNPDVAAAPPTFFSVQPTLTEANATINDSGGPGVQVTVLDQFENPRSGDGVLVAIDPSSPSGATLACTPSSAWRPQTRRA